MAAILAATVDVPLSGVAVAVAVGTRIEISIASFKLVGGDVGCGS
jgi:hypothetical protein